MSLSKRYRPEDQEPALQKNWDEQGVYDFRPDKPGEVYTVDTPPPTVSGKLHLGHVYSYSHVDFMVRYFRMRGRNIFYPMGFDDNGLPTEHLVERELGKTAQEMGRQAFIEVCLSISKDAEKAYEALWRRLGLSIDWRYAYRTIDDHSRRISQRSFMDLYEKGLVYQKEAPTLWCPVCQTALAQADLVDVMRESEFVVLDFELQEGGKVAIATTRPELLPACVAVFVHPDDPRYQHLIGQKAIVPLFNQVVPVLGDTLADPEKGTGVVMCCTFGDQMDILWWQKHDLPLVEVIDAQGCMKAAADAFAGMPVENARKAVKQALAAAGVMSRRYKTTHSIRAHDRDDVPVEFLTNRQWFIRVLDQKEKWLALGDQLLWHPDTMKNRYTSWVENLNWDWCISRQRYYGVPFPVWYCADCGEPILPDAARLPVDPLSDAPESPCPACGSRAYLPEEDVLDTWATSSMTPLIVTRWLSDQKLHQKLFPMTLRPQAHEIIRTWTFYSVVKSYYHFEALPWQEVLISGWGIAGEGMGKISKSKGGGPMPPMAMLEKYSADAVRYWASSTSTGKDAVISEEKIAVGQKLVTKLWNLARFSERFLSKPAPSVAWADLTSGDRWILSMLQDLIARVTAAMDQYDYAYAKNEIEKCLWLFADNYLEMAKGRLYSDEEDLKQTARFTLSYALLTFLKLFAPFMPHVTEAIYLNLFRSKEAADSIHTTSWPKREEAFYDQAALDAGEVLIQISSIVRGFKSQRGLSLGTPLQRLSLRVEDESLRALLMRAVPDLKSVTRAETIKMVTTFELDTAVFELFEGHLAVGISPIPD